MDWPLAFTGESCLGEHAIKDQQFITLSLSTNPPVFFACLPRPPVCVADATGRQALSRAILFHGTRCYNNTLGGHGFRRYVNKTPETSPEDTISLESA